MEATTSPALQDYKDGVNKRMAERFTEQVIWMKAYGVVAVKIDYDGSGDSGQMGELKLLDKDNKAVEYSQGLFQDMADMFEKMTEEHDWWNNDGGYGEMFWDLETNTFKWSHSQRISSTEDYQYGEAELIVALK